MFFLQDPRGRGPSRLLQVSVCNRNLGNPDRFLSEHSPLHTRARLVYPPEWLLLLLHGGLVIRTIGDRR